MYISDFTYHRPKTIEEACKILQESKDGASLAGGTDLLVELKQRLRYHHDIVSLSNIKDLKSISEDGNYLVIGSGVTHSMVIASNIIRENFLAISETASKIGTEQIRNTGTVGGNLCTGASCCDMAPILIAYDATFEITSSAKVRRVLAKDFFISHRETCIKRGEILTKIIVPRPQGNTGVYFEKYGLREAAIISVASVAALVKLKDGICIDACIIIGSVAPTPTISIKANEVLKGKKDTEFTENSAILKQVGEAAVKDSLPIDDLRSSAEYRRNIIKVLTQRVVLKAAHRANNSRNMPK
jgi:carbon-monoxide dehydrogenase medium subunit